MISTKRLLLALAALALPLLAPAGASAAATITVEPRPGSNSFAPANMIRPLSEARFSWIWGPNGQGSAAPHDVVQNAGLWDSGEAKEEGQFAVTASAGSFPYFCSIHFGMEARVAVRPEAGSGYPGPFRVSWATQGTTTGRMYDVRFRIVGGRWQSWLEDAKGLSAVFGRAGNPISLGGTQRTYLFQARSKRTARKASGWSPTLRVGPASG